MSDANDQVDVGSAGRAPAIAEGLPQQLAQHLARHLQEGRRRYRCMAWRESVSVRFGGRPGGRLNRVHAVPAEARAAVLQ
jgi:hypothetical protein